MSTTSTTSSTPSSGTTPDAASRATPSKGVGRKLDPAPVGVRTRLAGLWAAMLFVFAYVDLFSFYRPDFRAAVEAGTVSGFTIGQGFLLGTTAYILLPSLMVYLVLVLPPQVNRVANIALAVVYAATIVAGAIGEWQYYVIGSAVEVALLSLVVRSAWRWPKRDDQAA